MALVVVGVPWLIVACKKSPVGTRASCDELHEAAVASGLAVASAGSCSTASDCVEIDHVTCDYGCSGYAVASAERARAVGEVAKINGSICKEWQDRDCARIAPLPVASCATPRIDCRKNRCAWRYPFDSLSADQCNALVAEADKELAAVLAKATPTCYSDADCAVVSEHACFADCGGRVIGRDALATYQAASTRLQNGQCAKWHDGDCMTTTPRPVPSCPPVSAKCMKGKKPPNVEVTPPGVCAIER